MDHDSFDLDFLAQETFKISENINHADIQGDLFIHKDSDYQAEKQKHYFYPERSGVVFSIDRGMSTFCVRAKSVENIKSFFSRSDLESFKSEFKIDQDEKILEELHYFPTDTIEMAEVVVDHLGARRFPIEEDILCNLSDPGFSWWMNIHEKGIQIYFKSHGISRAEKYVRLGPIGDNMIAQARFNKLESVLRSMFPVSEFAVGPKGINISTSNIEKETYQSFLDIFTKGECRLEEAKFKNIKRGQTLYLYLKELAHIRRFWLNVEGLL